MVLPKRCCVSAWGLAAHRFQQFTRRRRISTAKSANKMLGLPRASRAATELVAIDFLTNESNGSELNSETKLTEQG